MLFAEAIKRFLESHAWKTDILSPSDGGGIHLIAEKDFIRYGIRLSDDRSGTVGADAVRQAIAGAALHGCERAAVIAQSQFGGGAQREAAAADPAVVLIDKDNFSRAVQLLERTWKDAEPEAPKGKLPWKGIAIAAAVILIGAGAWLALMPGEPPQPLQRPIEIAKAAQSPAAPLAPSATEPPPSPAPTPAPPPDNTLTPEEQADGWILLFDGQFMDGWGNSDRERVRLPVTEKSINPHGCGEQLLFHNKAWGDFDLKLDYKISPGFDRGVCVRVYPTKPIPGGKLLDNATEISIADKTDGSYEAAGGIYGFVKPTKNAARPAGEWNHLEIHCEKGVVAVELNGELTASMDQDEWTVPRLRPDGTRHHLPVALRVRAKLGYIGLPDPGKPAWFKNIKIRPKKKN